MCCISRAQGVVHEILENSLTKANTTLDAAAKLSIGGDIIDELSLNSLIKEKNRESLLNKLVKNADKVNADAHCMYDPEIHPDSGESVKGGKEQLFFWTSKKIEESY